MVGIVQARQQLDQRRFAGAVGTHQRDLLTGPDGQVHVLQSPAVLALVSEGDVAQLDALADRVGHGLRTGGIFHLRPKLEKGEQVAHEQAVLVEVGQAGEDCLEDRLAAAEDAQVQGHVAEGDRRAHCAPHDPGVRRVIGDRRQQSPAQRSQTPLARDRLVLPHEFPEQLGITEQQRLPETEQLDLLDRAVVGQSHLQVGQHARLRRPPRQHAEGQLGVFALGDERRDGRGKQDERQPRAEADEQGAERQQRDRVLDQVEAAVHDLQAAAVGLAAGVLELVVVVGVLEGRQVQVQRLSDDAGVDVQIDLSVEDVFGELARLGVGGLRHEQDELDGQQRQHGAQSGRRAHVGVDRPDHQVHDQLADPGLARWQDRADERTARHGQGGRRMRAPDQRKRAPDVRSGGPYFGAPLRDRLAGVRLGRHWWTSSP